MKTKIRSYGLLVVAILNTAMLAFAYRDLSWELVAMALLSVLGLPLASYMLYTNYKTQPDVVLVTKDEKTGELSHWYQHIDEKDDDDEEFNLKGRFCVEPHK